MVAGSWQTATGENEAYVVLFDGVPVPTETVHPGLLKCHAPGESNLQIQIELSLYPHWL